MRRGFALSLLLLLVLTAQPAWADAQGFRHHVIGVQLATKIEQTAQPGLTDFYLDLGKRDGIEPGTEFWAYRLEPFGYGAPVAIPVARLAAFHVEPRLCIARIVELSLPTDSALVDYRTVLVGDAVEPILGTGLPPYGSHDFPPEVRELDPTTLPAVGDADRYMRRIAIPNVVLFDFDKSTLRPEGRELLKQIAEYIRSTSAQQVLIEGHTDAIGTLAYNEGLSKRRAAAVKDYFTGVEKIAPQIITAVGFGETRPVASNATDAGRQRNRRSVITINGQQPLQEVPDGLRIPADDLETQVEQAPMPVMPEAGSAGGEEDGDFSLPELARPRR